MSQAEGAAKNRLRAEWNELFRVVHSEELGEVAAEFDRIHSAHRAVEVGALHDIIPPKNLRPYLVQAIERSIAKEQPAPSHDTKLEDSAGVRDSALVLPAP